MRQKIEDQIGRLLGAYEQSARASSQSERDAADAQGKQVILEIAVDTMMLFHGINEHLGRIAIALEKSNRPLPPADRLFNQS